MYKIILRTLSAFLILTITASAGFAAHEADELDIDCTDPANTYVEKCRAEANIEPVTTDVWKDSFESVPPPVEPNPTSRTDQFVLPADSLDHYTNKQRVNLKFDANNDGTDTIVGSSIFYMNKTGDKRNFYAGIRIGADLGEPLVEAFPEVVWKTRFKAVGTRIISKRDFYINEIFDLTVKFIGTSDGTQTRTMGEISGYIQQSGYYGFKIDAQFNDDGVITTGTGGITYGRFENAGAAPTETVVGNLTGIIGDRGALGAFHSDSASSNQILGFAGGFRANGFSEDELTVLRKCVLDPFHVQCGEDKFDDLKEARIELCIEGDNASDTNQIECHNAVVAEGCILNPFQTTCTGDMSDFNKYSEVARTNRIAFCDSRVNAKNALCKGDIVTDVCPDSPLHAICGDDYDEKANARLILCRQDGIVAGDSRCVQAEPIIDICELTPFKDECTWGAFDDERKELITACHDTGECAAAVLELPNAGTWANSFKTEDNPKGLGILPDADTYDYDKPFLKNIESASQPDSGIEIYIGDHSNTYKSLNLSTATFNISDTPDAKGTPLGGDAKDGVASFRGHATGQSTKHWYAGIFSTTDLGAPLTAPSANESKTASWVGSFYRGRDWGHQSSKDFVLEVNFDTQSIEAFVGRYYYLKGDYDANGVISGTVTEDGFINRYKPVYGEVGNIHALTGLIGKEGAVGAFSYGGFVARPADLVVDETTGKNAETFLNKTCTDDPFHEFCYLSDKREERIRHCSTNDNAINTDTNIVNWDCMTDVESDSCIRHPFDEKCKPTATSHYETARENRSAFCKKDANVAHLFCIGAEQNALCLYDPFHTICSNAIYNNARKAVCKAGFDHPDCATEAYRPPLKNKVTAISWLAGLYKDDGVVPQTKPDTIRPRDQFLQGTTDGLDNGDVEIGTTYSGDVPQFGSLNLDTATFDGLELGLGKDRQGREDAADDGFAFFQGSNYVGYAGIFSGTDLGEPLDSPTTATWYGQFQLGTWLKTDFTLDVTFDGSVGTVEAFVHRGGTNYLPLKGTFDENGVISGTVAYGDFPNHNQTISNIEFNAPLTGLIGAEGAVGVFTGGILAGGFVASSKSAADAFDPNVKFSDWRRSFGNTPPLLTYVQWNETQQTQFFQGMETGLDTRYIGGAVPQTLLTLADGDLGGESADGVAYAFFNRRYHVAGLLSGTHLGGVLPTILAGANGAITAIWDGKLGLIADGSEIPKRDIKLTVDFTNKEISHKSEVGGKHLVKFNATWNSGVGYDGMLDGVFTGEITYDKTPTLQTDGSYVANDSSKSEGIVTGIIGQDGAVGAFRSDGTVTTPYAGGFVAVPVVNHLNWVNSFGTAGLPSVPTTAPTPKNQFLQNGVAALRGNGFNPVDPASLDGTSITFGGVALSGGEATDGVTFASATRGVGTERANYYYAELSSTTNLGSPLSQTSGRATATGLFRFVNNYAVQRAVDFKLKITFGDGGAGRINAFIPASLASLSNAFFLTGTFNGSGVIKGDIYNNSNLTETTTSAQIDNDPMLRKNHGIIRGLIGQQGAVGAFISDATGSSGYAGGFVAVPEVNYANWVHSFGDPTSLPTSVPWYEPQRQTRFLQGRETDLNPGLINNPVTRSLTLANGDLGGEAADGVAYMSGTWDVDNSDVPRHYAGILSGTNLGAPLDASVAATWSGKLGMIVDTVNVPPRDITLNINFASKTISHSSAVNGAHFVDLSAKWINYDSPDGVLKGTITYNPGAALNDATNSAGKVTGLIGQQGAVGAFISNYDNPSSKAAYAGGFVARPPSE